MSKSFSARVVSDLLELFGMYTESNSERMIAGALGKGERPTPPPRNLETRFEDSQCGRVFYANEGSTSGNVVFYIHGGAYFMDFAKEHWRLLEKLVRETDVQLIAPAYRLVPFATYREAFDLIVPLYREYREAHPDKNVILMGDSAGGGLSLALAEHFKAEGMRMPDRLILLSPWVDVSLENKQIAEYESVDPFLKVKPLRDCAELWKGDLDVHDWHVSPIYGELKGIRNATVFVGTDGILYPDITKIFGMLDEDPSNELVVGEGMNHVYPLLPIPEAKPAVDKIIRTIRSL
ncbi:MAG: alpha/beta hydrolase [Coriobacteriales bacterium]|nr:alpha/beta hydrolase [Coriobacteriales bacterium]